MNRRQPDVVLMIALAALVFAVFANSLGGAFVLDDHMLIDENPNAQRLDGVALAFRTDLGHFLTGAATPAIYYRPIPLASYAVDWAVYGAHPAPYHAENVVWHAIAAVLAFVLLRRLIGSPWAAFFAVALWAVHPATSESVAWIAGRPDPMLAVWTLGALLAFVRHLERGGRLSLATAMLLTYCACLTKESGTLLPFEALCVGWVLGPAVRRGAPRLWRPVLLLFVPVVVYAVQRRLALGASSLTLEPGLVTALRAAALTARAWLWPAHLVGDMTLSAAPASASALFLGGMIVAVLAIGAVVLFARRRISGLCLVLACLSILPTSGFLVALQMPVAMRYLYVPSLWLLGALAALVVEMLPSRAQRAAAAIAAVLVVTLAIVTVRHNRDYRDDAALYASIVRNASLSGVEPGYGTLENYTRLLANEGRLQDAERFARVAVAQKPDVAVGWKHLGNVLALQKNYSGALDAWRRAHALDPMDASIVIVSAEALEELNRRQEAIDAFRAARRMTLTDEQRGIVDEHLRALVPADTLRLDRP
jgi:hypothetical protein